MKNKSNTGVEKDEKRGAFIAHVRKSDGIQSKNLIY